MTSRRATSTLCPGNLRILRACRTPDRRGSGRLLFLVAPGCLLALFVLGPGCNSGGGGGSSGSGGGTATPPQNPEAPSAFLVVTPTSGVAPHTVSFDGTSSSDPQGDTLSYFWDFGDGSTSTDPAGSMTYTADGSFDVLLVVTDPEGNSDQAQVTIVVLATLPQETFEHSVLHLTNLEREQNGVPPLRWHDQLAAAAEGHCIDMANQDYFDHTSLDGRSPWDRIRAEGYDFLAAGENIAAGYATPAEVMVGWMNSPGHRANILSADFNEMGVGYFFESNDTYPGPVGYRHYWGQNFGRRGDVYPVIIENEAFDTATRDVALYIYGAGWAREMKISEDPGFAGVSWQPFQTTSMWTLSAGSGLKRVHVRLRRAIVEHDSFDEIVLR